MIDKSIEENFKKIEDLLEELENSKDNLDESIKIYEKASDIYIKLEKRLSEYKAKVETITSDEWYGLRKIWK